MDRFRPARYNRDRVLRANGSAVDYNRYAMRRSLAQREAAMLSGPFKRVHALKKKKNSATKKIQSIARRNSAMRTLVDLKNSRAADQVLAITNRRMIPRQARTTLHSFLRARGTKKRRRTGKRRSRRYSKRGAIRCTKRTKRTRR